MKRFTCMILCGALTLSAAALSACGQAGDSTKASSAVETTAAPATEAAPTSDNPAGTEAASAATAPAATEAAPTADNPAATEAASAATAPAATETDLSKLFKTINHDTPLAGTWQIAEGAGSQFEHFYYLFDGEGTAYLLVGTMGYIAPYKLSKSEDKDVITCQMMFGINGTYTIENEEGVPGTKLTDTKTTETLNLSFAGDYSAVPDAPESPEIDEAILGAWRDDHGETLYFDKNGIFLDLQEGMAFTFYTYSAKDGKITQTYTMTEPITETASYSLEDDTLTYNGYEYKRISADEIV